MATTTERIQDGLKTLQAKLENPDDQIGQSIILRTISTVLRDASQPWLGTVNVPVDLELVGLVELYTVREINGETIQQGDVQCILLREGLGTTVPTTVNQVTWEGTTYAVNHVTPTFVGDTAEVYELRLRA